MKTVLLNSNINEKVQSDASMERQVSFFFADLLECRLIIIDIHVTNCLFIRNNCFINCVRCLLS